MSFINIDYVNSHIYMHDKSKDKIVKLNWINDLQNVLYVKILHLFMSIIKKHDCNSILYIYVYKFTQYH